LHRVHGREAPSKALSRRAFLFEEEPTKETFSVSNIKFLADEIRLSIARRDDDRALLGPLEGEEECSKTFSNGGENKKHMKETEKGSVFSRSRMSV